MKRREKHKGEEEDDVKEKEILKAVAQAWHGHSSNPGPANEFDAERSQYRSRPSRFKLEALNMVAKEVGASWDFSQSLWDSYEIVTLSRKLESGMVMDRPIEEEEENGRALTDLNRKRRRESKNSLRNLFNRISSKRFDIDLSVPSEDDNYE